MTLQLLDVHTLTDGTPTVEEEGSALNKFANVAHSACVKLVACCTTVFVEQPTMLALRGVKVNERVSVVAVIICLLQLCSHTLFGAIAVSTHGRPLTWYACGLVPLE
jgi:hypothetical protein